MNELAYLHENRNPNYEAEANSNLNQLRGAHMMNPIGAKPGTGGSSGAEYLRGTLFHPAFPDLWAIRSQI